MKMYRSMVECPVYSEYTHTPSTPPTPTHHTHTHTHTHTHRIVSTLRGGRVLDVVLGYDGDSPGECADTSFNAPALTSLNSSERKEIDVGR